MRKGLSHTTGLLGLILLVLARGATADVPAGYYEGVDANSPEALRSSLHEIIDDHQRFPYTSFETDTWDILEIADENRDDPAQIITIYRNAAFGKQGGGNDFYNREHVWPKSYGFPDNEDLNYPYTDMHALFLADPDYNFARSNSPFNYCGETCLEFTTGNNNGRGGQGSGYPGDSNWQMGEFTQGVWEVWKGRRGDIARALMYMDVRYEGGRHGITGASEPDLILTDDLGRIDASRTGRNEAVAYMGMRSVLLEWHRQDPVDFIEMQHHEAVASFQGNRNPFIDHPEWAACIFESNCSFFHINAGISDAWFEPATAGQGFFIIVWEDLKMIFLAWFTYDTERPPEDVKAVLGEPGHRWLTAQGPYEGGTALLDLYESGGGVFDKGEPPVETMKKGRIRLQFTGCNEGVLSYEIPSAGRTGQVPIQRIVLDNVPRCEALNAAAGP